MKHLFRRALALFLAAMTAATALTLPAAASEAMGGELSTEETGVHHTAALSTNIFWSSSYSDLRTENYITYTPGGAVTPMVTYGNALTSRSTLSKQARALEAQGYRVIGGINGDYFDIPNGLPIGLVVTDGQLKSTDAGLYAIGFRADGSAILGRPSLRITADLGYTEGDGVNSTQAVRILTAVNKARLSTGGIYLYTYDFNDRRTTGTTEVGTDVICRIVEGSLAIGSTLTLQVEQVLTNTYATSIQPDQVVLSVNNQSSSWNTGALNNIPVGATVTVSVTASSEGWDDVQYAVGGLYSLLENGQVPAGLPTGLNPRTAIGQKSDGTLVFYTMDGRQSGHSIGASLTQVGQRLAELGCVSAICLDGGGSTTIAVTEPGDPAAQIINSPSDGWERSVSNHIFLVAESTPTDVFSHFHLSAENRYVLAGSQVALSAVAVDSNYIRMDHPFSLSSSAGELTEDGNGGWLLRTPAEGGELTVTASDGTRSDTLTIHTVTTPDSIVIKHDGDDLSTLTLAPGDTLQLTASAIYNHLPLQSDPAAFTWTLAGDMATVSPDGLITAEGIGVGVLIVSAGNRSVSMFITVSDLPLHTLEDFEGLDSLSVSGIGADAGIVNTSAQVKLGRASAQVDYSLASAGVAVMLFSEAYTLPDSRYHRLNLWVQGSGTGDLLSLATTGSSGLTTTPLIAMDSTDWQLISVELPAETKSILGFAVTGSTEFLSDSSIPAPTGSFRVDQLVASYGDTMDTTVPDINLYLRGNDAGHALTAIVFDEVDGVLPRSAISVTLDGQEMDFTYDETLGVISADLPIADSWSHRVSVFARDASGNIGRASADIASSAEDPVFSDIGDHWAADYIAWLKTAGITSGYSDNTFRPDQSLTRQQFASMLFNYLQLDAADYESVELPFADADQISGYALPAVKALYTMGVISGTEKDGQLYFLPYGNLTRAQAAAMIGRTQEKGFATQELTFTDTAAIPSYAREYISTMAAQGVLSGYSDNTFRPGNGITRGQMAKILYSLL